MRSKFEICVLLCAVAAFAGCKKSSAETESSPASTAGGKAAAAEPLVEIDIPASSLSAKAKLAGGEARRRSDNLFIYLIADCAGDLPVTATGYVDTMALETRCPDHKYVNVYIWDKDIKAQTYAGKNGSKDWVTIEAGTLKSGGGLGSGEPGKGVTIKKISDAEVEGEIDFKDTLGSSVRAKFKVPIKK